MRTDQPNTLFMSERTRNSVPTAPEERCARCGERAYQHTWAAAGVLVCGAPPRAAARIDELAGTLKMLMDQAIVKGEIVGVELAEPGRLTIPQAVRQSSPTTLTIGPADAMRRGLKQLGASRYQRREALKRDLAEDRAIESATATETGRAILAREANRIAQMQQVFAEYLGVPLSNVEQAFTELGPEEFERLFNKREEVKRQFESSKQAAEVQLAAEQARRALLTAYAARSGASQIRVAPVFEDDGEWLGQPRTAAPKPRAEQPAVAVAARRKYFGED